MNKGHRISGTGERIAADSALTKSFTPKATPVTATTTLLSVKGSQQPKATPVETKQSAPPSKND